MRIGIAPTNPMERILFAGAKVPMPFFETWFTFMHARAIMAAVKLGIFEALAQKPQDASEVATRCGTHPRATWILLDALVSARYLRFDSN
ncbi:MAG: methyltransferase dimerization domain-containing protein, partial [Thermoplasmata archaeon]